MKGWLLALALCTGVCQAETLRVLNWEGYIAPGVLADFTEQTGVDVEYRTFTTAAALEQALASDAPYDVIAPSHFQLSGLIERGKIQRLDKRQLKHYDNLDPGLLASLATFSRAVDYVVPYLWTTVGLVTDDALVTEQLGAEPPNSWSLLFDSQQASKVSRCGIGWIDAPEETFSLLLNYQGRQLARLSPRGIERSAQTLQQLAGTLRTLDNDRYIDDLAAGRLCASMAWAGHAIRASGKRPTLHYRIPQEGGLLTVDSWAIPTNAAHPELAHRFIDFMLSAPVAVKNTRSTSFYSPLKGALPELEALRSTDPQLVPTGEGRERLYFLEQPSPDQKAVIDRYWAQLRKDRTD